MVGQHRAAKRTVGRLTLVAGTVRNGGYLLRCREGQVTAGHMRYRTYLVRGGCALRGVLFHAVVGTLYDPAGKNHEYQDPKQAEICYF